MFKLSVLFSSFFLLLMMDFYLPNLARAESIKFVQWWDEYLPQRQDNNVEVAYSRRPQAQHFLDLDGDEIANDSQVCIPFDMQNLLTPPTMCQNGQSTASWRGYRSLRPGAPFYGGMVANYLNMSDVTVVNSRGNEVPVATRFSQASVQQDGASFGLGYQVGHPDNIRRGINQFYKIYWSDITLFAVDGQSEKGEMVGWVEPSISFHQTPNAKVNFGSIFMWKKENFVNGGASAKRVILDPTSKFFVSRIRHAWNADDGRFVIQDGEDFYFSEYQIDVKTGGFTGINIAMSPLESRWAKYTPNNCDLIFDANTAEFIDHEFTDIQAVGVYFAMAEYLKDRSAISFDNFMFYGTTPEMQSDDPMPSSYELDGESFPGIAFDAAAQPLSTQARFFSGVTPHNQLVTIKPTDQIDVRGRITVDPAHVGQQADLLVVAEVLTDGCESGENCQFFYRFNLDASVTEIVFNEQTTTEDLGSVREVTLFPEQLMQIFPVNLENFRATESGMKDILISCNSRPITYTGIFGAGSGLLRFYYGYRLKEDGTTVITSNPIQIRLQETETEIETGTGSETGTETTEETAL